MKQVIASCSFFCFFLCFHFQINWCNFKRDANFVLLFHVVRLFKEFWSKGTPCASKIKPFHLGPYRGFSLGEVSWLESPLVPMGPISYSYPGPDDPIGHSTHCPGPLKNIKSPSKIQQRKYSHTLTHPCRPRKSRTSLFGPFVVVVFLCNVSIGFYFYMKINWGRPQIPWYPLIESPAVSTGRHAPTQTEYTWNSNSNPLEFGKASYYVKADPKTQYLY